jgi:hypothetical protein
MSTEDLVLVIDKPSFEVKLHESLLEVDLKKGAKKKLEEALESSPSLRGSLGFIFQSVVPLDIPLKDIESVELDEKKQVKIRTPHRRDITIPLEASESKKLVSKLKELIPAAKQREMERLLASKEAKKQLAYERMESKRAMDERILGRERE